MDIASWLDVYYQYANRLAVAHFLTEHGYQAHFVMLYFIGDLGNASRKTPQAPEGWSDALRAQKEKMGLLVNHYLSPCVHELYLHVSELKAWSKPDSNSEIPLVRLGG